MTRIQTFFGPVACSRDFDFPCRGGIDILLYKEDLTGIPHKTLVQYMILCQCRRYRYNILDFCGNNLYNIVQIAILIHLRLT